MLWTAVFHVESRKIQKVKEAAVVHAKLASSASQILVTERIITVRKILERSLAGNLPTLPGKYERLRQEFSRSSGRAINSSATKCDGLCSSGSCGSYAGKVLHLQYVFSSSDPGKWMEWRSDR